MDGRSVLSFIRLGRLGLCYRTLLFSGSRLKTPARKKRFPFLRSRWVSVFWLSVCWSLVAVRCSSFGSISFRRASRHDRRSAWKRDRIRAPLLDEPRSSHGFRSCFSSVLFFRVFRFFLGCRSRNKSEELLSVYSAEWLQLSKAKKMTLLRKPLWRKERSRFRTDKGPSPELPALPAASAPVVQPRAEEIKN